MRGRIFIVEDDRDTAELMAVILVTAGYEVVGWAADGHQALDAYLRLRRHPDLVIVDFQLPGRNGMEVAREIRARHPAVHLLACSANPETADAFHRLERCLFLAKPFSVSELKAAVDLALSERGGRMRELLAAAK